MARPWPKFPLSGSTTVPADSPVLQQLRKHRIHRKIGTTLSFRLPPTGPTADQVRCFHRAHCAAHTVTTMPSDTPRTDNMPQTTTFDRAMEPLDASFLESLKAARGALLEPTYLKSARDFAAAQEFQNIAALTKTSEARLAEAALKAAKSTGMFDSLAEYTKRLSNPMIGEASQSRHRLTVDQALLGEALAARNKASLFAAGTVTAALAAQQDAFASMRRTIDQLIGHTFDSPSQFSLKEAKRIRNMFGAESSARMHAQLASESRKGVGDALSSSNALKTLIGAVEELNRLPVSELRTARGVASVESLFSSAAMAFVNEGKPVAVTGGSALPLQDSLAVIHQQLDREVKALTEAPMSNEMVLAISIFVNFVVLVLTLLLAPVADFHIKRKLEELYKPDATKKEMLEKTREAIPDFRALEAFRFVHKRPLQIRASASSKAQVIGNAPPGAAVYLVEQNGPFALVEWQPCEGASLVRGWAFTRHLRRFR